ncbi:MAG: DUF2617 family protein [Gemmataceae bacterium]|nr:DUF2617 family protein [Gemmataceae bacterium]
MHGLLARPPIADLVLQVHGRTLHPEFFDVLSTHRLRREGFDLAVRITRSGHVLTIENERMIATEVVDVEGPLPSDRLLWNARLRGEHGGTIRLWDDRTYRVNFQVETLTPAAFRHVHDEILTDACREGILHHFSPNRRLSFAPLAYVKFDSKPGCLFVSTFHTFPDEHAIVKTQSLLERSV